MVCQTNKTHASRLTRDTLYILMKHLRLFTTYLTYSLNKHFITYLTYSLLTQTLHYILYIHITHSEPKTHSRLKQILPSPQVPRHTNDALIFLHGNTHLRSLPLTAHIIPLSTIKHPEEPLEKLRIHSSLSTPDPLRTHTLKKHSAVSPTNAQILDYNRPDNVIFPGELWPNLHQQKA